MTLTALATSNFDRSISQSVSSLDRDDDDSEVIKQEMEIKKELAEWENQEKLLKEELENMELDEVKEKSTQEKVIVNNKIWLDSGYFIKKMFRFWM